MLVRVPVLSHLEFDIIWEELGLGERPYPLTIGSFGETLSEREVLREQVLGVLDERVEDLLTLLVRNQFTVDGLIAAGRELRVLAAARGDHGLLAVQTDQELRLSPMRRTDVVSSVVALLPEEKPGPGSPVSLPKALFNEAAEAYAGGGYLAFEMTLNRGGVAGRDLRLLGTLVESGRHGGGQLAANRVDQIGRRTRSPVLTWFDTEAGRYVVSTERRGREEWLAFTPGDPQRIARRLTELVAETGV